VRTKKNDIALIRLSEAADTSRNNIKTICLPINTENDIEIIWRDHVRKNMKLKLIIAGFGRIGNGVSSDVLQKAYVPFVTNENCMQRYRETPSTAKIAILKEFICAGGFNRTDTCRGDSGEFFYLF
jgi:secreted trypsin-like serine protease